MGYSALESIVNWSKDPSSLSFLCISFGMIVAPISLSALGKIMRRSHAMSIFSFFTFYFLGPVAHFFSFSLLEPIEFPALILLGTLIYFPQHIILPIQGLSRISGISRRIFWFKRRLWLVFIFDLTSALRVMGASRLARWLKTHLMPHGGYQRWKVTWGSYLIFLLGAFWSAIALGAFE